MAISCRKSQRKLRKLTEKSVPEQHLYSHYIHAHIHRLHMHAQTEPEPRRPIKRSCSNNTQSQGLHAINLPSAEREGEAPNHRARALQKQRRPPSHSRQLHQSAFCAVPKPIWPPHESRTLEQRSANRQSRYRDGWGQSKMADRAKITQHPARLSRKYYTRMNTAMEEN